MDIYCAHPECQAVVRVSASITSFSVTEDGLGPDVIYEMPPAPWVRGVNGLWFCGDHETPYDPRGEVQMRRPSLLWLLNFFLVQWFFVRVARVEDRRTGRTISWKLLRWVVPLTGWWSPYTYWPWRVDKA